jgi:hypothetical protein
VPDLTDREFEEVYGGKPPAKLEFFLRGDELYHRELGGWRLYPPEARDCNREESTRG